MNPIALVAYESRFARCGGVTAVLNYLPAHLQAKSGAPVTVITPFHVHSPATTSLKTKVVGEITIPFAGDDVPIVLRQYEERWPWVFVDAARYTVPSKSRVYPDDEHLFAGRRHPYDVGRDGAEQLEILRRDALVFGVAVACALPLLDAEANWSLLLQDWQAATAALALAVPGNRHRCHLTLHNSYDSGAASDKELRRFGIDPARVPAAVGTTAETVLTRAWPVVRKPIFTVSEQFALDITGDPFQQRVMADHLQQILAAPHLIGINNGPFAALAVPQDALAEARGGDLRPLRSWKEAQRQQAMSALEAFRPTPDRVVWGDIPKFLQRAGRPDSAWYVLAGRDDPRQKGYDVAAAAIDRLLAKPEHEAAQFIFFPIPGDEGRPGLGFLQTLAERYPANVLVLPFIFVEGYTTTLQGAAFGVMPSLYEPFGMANEFYLNGALGIGRATGGLVQQIVPLRGVPSLTPAVDKRALRWHHDAAPTGLLFREPDDLPDAAADWQRFNLSKYELEGPNDRVRVRWKIPLYRAMAAALEQVLADSLALYDESPGRERYLAMLVAGIDHTQQTFSWDKTATEYKRYL